MPAEPEVPAEPDEPAETAIDLPKYPETSQTPEEKP